MKKTIMRNLYPILLFCMLVLASAGYAEENAAKKQPNKETVVLYCDLHCQGCCDKVMKNIAWEKGVKDLVCDLKSQSVTVTYDPRKTDLPTLLKAFERIGKPATPVQKQKGSGGEPW